MSDWSLFDYSRQWWARLLYAIFFSLLYAPILTLIIFSFNDSKRNVIWRGFTLKYYAKAWANESLIEAFCNSLIIALANAVLGTILGVMTAVWLWRFRFPFKSFVEGTLALPIVIPEICMGVAMLIFFNRFWMSDLSWPWSLSNIIIAHVTFTFPFVAVIIRGRLSQVNNELEQAAIDLGANQWQAMCDILFPQIKPAILVSTLIAFTLSLDDFVITYFTAAPDSITLPVKIYSMVRFSVTPQINAISTVLIMIAVTLIILTAWLTQKDKR